MALGQVGEPAPRARHTAPTTPEAHRLDVETARWLVGDDGRHLLRAARAALAAGQSELAVGTTLRERGVPAERAAAVTAVASAAGELLGELAAIEQSSHPLVAAWRAQRFRGTGLVIDLCAGIGGDAIAIADAAGHVAAVELDPVRATFLAANARHAAARVSAIVGDARRPPVPTVGLLHADPSRRHDGRRARRLRDYLPPVPLLDEVTARAAGRAIVVSPGVDLDDPDLPAGELEFTEVDGDLVEAVVWTGDLRRGVATATLLPAGVTRSRDAAVGPLAVGDVGDWLLEPSPAAVRARLHDAIGEEAGARRIARRRALLTADHPPPPSPWYRSRRVAAVLPARARAVRDWLRGREPRPVEIAVHGMEVDPPTFWRAIGRPARGPSGWRIDLVRLDRGAVAIVGAT